MEYNIKSKETIYNSVKYRSRLEARWAAFFDLVGWRFFYEPSEINGYNPDFILQCNSNSYSTQTCIIEVKPQVLLTKDEINIIKNKYISTPAHLLILTDQPFVMDDGYLKIGIGWQHYELIEKHIYNLEMKCINDFGSQYMSYDGVIYGEVERKRFLTEKDYKEVGELIQLWAEAGNKTQFKVL